MVNPELVPFGDVSTELAVIEAAEPPGLPGSNPTLALQHMEAALVRADLECPDVLSPEQFRRLRYLLSFARLTVFEPGAAGPGGTRGRGDVTVGDEIAGFRARVIDALYHALRGRTTAQERLDAAKAILASFAEDVDYERSLLLERHANDFSAAELDAELGYKTYVAVLGGGGGAGYVYLGGMQRMLAAGLPPAYMLTNSFGAIVGSVMARVLPVPIEDYVAWAKTVTYRGVLAPARTRRRHGLNGLFSLQFNEFAKEMFTREDGEPMRMTDLLDPVRDRRRRRPEAVLRPAARPVPSVALHDDGCTSARAPQAGLRPRRRQPAVAGRRVHRFPRRQADRARRRRSDGRLQCR